MTPRKKQSGNARQRIGDSVNARLDDTTIDQLLEAALEATIGVKASCPSCGDEFTVKMKDAKKAIDAVTALLEQAEGRPELRHTDVVPVVIERPPL